MSCEPEGTVVAVMWHVLCLSIYALCGGLLADPGKPVVTLSVSASPPVGLLGQHSASERDPGHHLCLLSFPLLKDHWGINQPGKRRDHSFLPH